jgi:hypothetical protein
MKILAYRLPEFEAKIAKFNKKAIRWELPEIKYQVTERFLDTRRVPDGEDQFGNPVLKSIQVEAVRVEIQGEVPRLGGWSIHSKIQPSDVKGQNFVFTTANHAPIPRLRTCPMFCDHCQTKRLKKTAYLIQHEDGRQMMVGATCLKDFLPTVNVEDLIAYMNNLGSVNDDEGWDMDVPRAAWAYYLDEAIMDAYVSIKKHGFVSKAKAEERGIEPTSHDINPSRKRREELYKGVLVQDLEDELKGFKEHMLAKDATGNDFIHNVQLALQSEVIRHKLYGYVAAAVNVWMKDGEEKRVAASGKAGDWVGVVGERLSIKGLKITRRSVSEGTWGATYIFGLVDEFGNHYTWFASRNVGEPGKVLNLRGTVKKHDEFHGIKQTVITRCSVF